MTNIEITEKLFTAIIESNYNEVKSIVLDNNIVLDNFKDNVIAYDVNRHMSKKEWRHTFEILNQFVSEEANYSFYASHD